MTTELINMREDIRDIKADIGDIKTDLSEHMARTAASEARLEIMEAFVQKSLDCQQQNFSAMLQSSKDHQNALNKQLKIALGVVISLATLVAALVPFINSVNN